jgi:hypothetical protein
VNNAASTARPEDACGRLVPAVLGNDGSERRPSLRRCLELRLEDGFAQGGRRRMSDAMAGCLGRSNDSFSLVWRREEQRGSKGAEEGSKASRGGENELASMTAHGRQWIRTASARGQRRAEHSVERVAGSCRTRAGRRSVIGCERFSRLLRLTSVPGFISIFQ